jgi:hypothetical protein
MRVKKVTIKPSRNAPRRSANHPLHDLRLAYELQGRIEILEGALAGSPFCDVSALTALAEQELAAGRLHDAAELLRAAEHLSFAALAPYAAGCPTHISAELKAAVTAEFNHITRCAELHWSESEAEAEAEATFRNGTLALLYAGALEEAHRALARGAYRAALELARAAEALAKTTHQTATQTHTQVPDRPRAHRLAS